MTRYWRISIPCRSASRRASADGRTLKPMTIAFDAAARLTSFSVMPPTPVWMTLTRTSACWIFCSSPTIASTEPWTSPLRTMLSSCTRPACICSNSFSRETPRLDGPAADVEAGLDDRAGRLGGRVRAQVELGIGDKQDLLEQVVEVLGVLRRH